MSCYVSKICEAAHRGFSRGQRCLGYMWAKSSVLHPVRTHAAGQGAGSLTAHTPRQAASTADGLCSEGGEHGGQGRQVLALGHCRYGWISQKS